MPTSFAQNTGSESVAVGVAAAGALTANTAVYNALTSDSPTLTAAQVVNGIVKISGQTGAQTVTTPSATDICALLPNLQVGSAFDFTLINANTSSGAATITAGAGVTVTQVPASVAIAKTQTFKGIVTNATTPTVTLYGLMTVGA
jgi:hypothetical protein